ncbi:zinc-dependent alcohol dehydrogenase family protein [Pseudomonas petrae]|uniref:zinc-dependent alcohol dehydrogenase family protein n=1 Tax=Pseudomonas petrae TaxID=2912190 RepID=UPI001EF07964|nr:zinc-dependent alcohol dehydrogenase family protein [Pseudomonas petrae]MCF7534016.1 zinc-dependent alcohol dehydrogenase family protein [Pseudomonas petrae]MCF7539369.1 zinc-dependent alcohol dehydrogenase family protein [Pseudomonas petrae]MCF7557254.1 zinc-dependent alcohol dehydrogenase family protein [Pseudomonas petrae]
MKAMMLNSFGGPESFELCDVPKPVPGTGHILVRVHATSINPLDYQVRRGDYPGYVPLPAITGHDVSGVVEEVGPGVTAFVPGDEVWYTPQIFDGPGSYAEYHVAAQNIVGKKPASLSHLEAASLSLVGGTAWEALTVRAALKVGESILIHGGAGGVGHVAIQLAKAIGAKVFTTVSEANFEFARSMGADVLIDYKKEDYVDAILRETEGRGVDVVFDTIGGDTLSRSPDALAQLGRVVTIVDIAQPQNLVEAWGKNASYHFIFTRQNRGKLDELSTLVARGQLRPHVGAVYSLADLALAHARLESPNNGLQGKIAISVAASSHPATAELSSGESHDL